MKQNCGVIVEEDEKLSPTYSLDSISNFSKGADAVLSENKNDSVSSSLNSDNYKKNFELFLEKNC